jgi:tetratricopeptide (TPR) repeat protein
VVRPEKPEQWLFPVIPSMNRPVAQLAQQESAQTIRQAHEALGALHGLFREYGEGKKHLKQALKLDPHREFSWTVLELVALEENLPEEALKVHQDHLAVKDTPTNRLLVAKRYERLGKYDEAIAILEPVLKSDPSDYRSPWSIGVLIVKRAMTQDDIKNADKHLHLAYNRGSGLMSIKEKCDFNTTIATLHAIGGDVEDARKLLNGVLSYDKENKYAKRVLEALGEEK